MITNQEVMNEVIRLSEKINDLSTKIDKLINNGSIALSELEVASAKIIADITEKLSEKTDYNSNKEVLDAIKNLPGGRKGKYSGLHKYSPPTGAVGNKELGSSSESLKAIIWPKKEEA